MNQLSISLSINLITILELLGTFAFAFSGIKMASNKELDWFGAYTIGVVTAIGGGTTRDLLLNSTPFWMLDPTAFIISALALLGVFLTGEKLTRWETPLFLFDTIGLGLFTIVGVIKSLEAGLSPWVCIVMGTITGSVGGVARDILLNRVPLLFQRDIYALASVSGGCLYFILSFLEVESQTTEVVSAIIVFTIRLLSVRFHIHLPRFKIPNRGSNKSHD